ncbi:MAG: ATP-binding protein [Nitrospirota bacterium]
MEAIGEWIIIYSVLGLIAFFAAIGLFRTYLMKKSISGIIDHIRKVEEGDLKTRIFTNRKDEIGMLAKGINSILSDLEESKKEIDRYHADEISHIGKMASIGEIASAVAHEIKNPLAGISGALQVLAEDFPDDSPRKEIANEVLGEIERLDMAVKDLLVFARPPELNLIPADINAIIEKVKNTIQADAHEIRVEIESISDNMSEVIIDPEQIEKAFLNIVNSSLHEMPDGGKLTMAIYNRHRSDEIEITFSDTGKGMSGEDLKNVFKPKFSTKHLCTGLGLAISRNIIERHKGKIFVESRIGSGSTFHIILPRKR